MSFYYKDDFCAETSIFRYRYKFIINNKNTSMFSKTVTKSFMNALYATKASKFFFNTYTIIYINLERKTEEARKKNMYYMLLILFLKTKIGFIYFKVKRNCCTFVVHEIHKIKIVNLVVGGKDG